MKPEIKMNKRTIWDHIWYPNEEDFIGFKVFQMISIPVIMVLSLVVNIFLKSAIWNSLMFFWVIVVVALGLITSLRYKIINPTKDKNGS
jgi:hypothetical protein